MCVCRYWTGYLSLCCELRRSTEAFSTICQLDDISLLEGADGMCLSRLSSAARSVGCCDVALGILVYRLHLVFAADV